MTAAPTTYYLDGLDLDQPNPSFLKSVRAQRLYFIGGGLLFVLFGVLYMWKDSELFFGGVYAAAGAAWMVRALVFTKGRPFARVGNEALVVRRRWRDAEQRFAWGDLAGLDLKPTAVTLHPKRGAPVRLSLMTLSYNEVRAFKEKLADTARRRGVPVA